MAKQRHARRGGREPLALSRRCFLRESLGAAGALATAGLGSVLPTVARAARHRPRGAVNFGPLGSADENGLRLPPGFQSRVVAVSEQTPASGSSYVWHGAPDGGATFPMSDGGWVYVSNSEERAGGVGALRFDAAANVVDAYPILTGTAGNCAGGPTPWGAWLSCEETPVGEVWECDPTGPSQGIVRPALGTFMHEGAAVDPFFGSVYLTEDRPSGLLYRFTPDTPEDLSSGTLEAAEATGDDPFLPRSLDWHLVANPNPGSGDTPTRHQVAAATPFAGGEGIFYRHGLVYFTTKGDDRVWCLDTIDGTLTLLYDPTTSPNPILSGVDNVLVTPIGDVLVAEDGGDMEIVALTRRGRVIPVLQLVGQDGSEVTGPALSPDGTRLYLSSQRGGPSGRGITYEVAGPFLR